MMLGTKEPCPQRDECLDHRISDNCPMVIANWARVQGNFCLPNPRHSPGYLFFESSRPADARCRQSRQRTARQEKLYISCCCHWRSIKERTCSPAALGTFGCPGLVEPRGRALEFIRDRGFSAIASQGGLAATTTPCQRSHLRQLNLRAI